ncbi:MAG: GNAT family N-acetyltransferase [Gammaproteobacteria bacterium]|nr:GNAT family N-acetyltransferase [Gammaproteobacteria bacterium]
MTTDFDYQPTLSGARVVARPIAATDWPSLSAAASDPGIWEQHPEPDRYRPEVFKRYFDGAMQSGAALVFVDRDSGDLIGSSRYHSLDPENREIEIGWTFLARDYWGGSYNAEIKQLMLDHAFRFVDTVVFWVGDANLRSRRAMEKLGAILRPGVQHRGARGGQAHVVYEIRRGY